MNRVLQIIIGFVLADIGSGIIHWFEDTYFDYCIDIPIISDISKDNELHHYFPRTIIAYSYLENSKYLLILSIIFFTIIFVINKSILFKYSYLFISFFLFASFANALHKHSHMRECENPYIITLLQKTGVLCSHNHHSLHHEHVDTKYCVISEYTNYVLDTVYFWRVVEYIIFIITGIEPNRKPKYDDYHSIHNYMHENAKLECPDKPNKKDIEILKDILREYKKCKSQK